MSDIEETPAPTTAEDLEWLIAHPRVLRPKTVEEAIEAIAIANASDDTAVNATSAMMDDICRRIINLEREGHAGVGSCARPESV